MGFSKRKPMNFVCFNNIKDFFFEPIQIFFVFLIHEYQEIDVFPNRMFDHSMIFEVDPCFFKSEFINITNITSFAAVKI